MPERRVADIVSQAGGLHDLPEMHRRKALGHVSPPGRRLPRQNAQRTPYAAYLQGVGQPVVDMIVPAQGMYLGLFRKPAERTGKYDSVVIL